MFMTAREPIVLFDLLISFRIRFHHVVTDIGWYIRQTHASAAERERIVHQHDIAASGEFVRPRHLLVIALLMPDHGWMLILRHLGDLPQTEVLVAAVIV